MTIEPPLLIRVALKCFYQDSSLIPAGWPCGPEDRSSPTGLPRGTVDIDELTERRRIRPLIDELISSGFVLVHICTDRRMGAWMPSYGTRFLFVSGGIARGLENAGDPQEALGTLIDEFTWETTYRVAPYGGKYLMMRVFGHAPQAIASADASA